MTSIIALNEYTSHAHPEADKVAELATEMAANGWVGAPVLTYNAEFAMTGTHRIAAAREAGIEIPTMDLAEVVDDADERIMEIQSELGGEGLEIAAALMVIALGEDRAEELGLDLDVAAMVADIEEM